MDAREQQAAAGRGQGAEKRQQQQQQQQEGGSSGLDGPVMGAEQFYANDLLRTADNGPQSGKSRGSDCAPAHDLGSWWPDQQLVDAAMTHPGAHPAPTAAPLLASRPEH